MFAPLYTVSREGIGIHVNRLANVLTEILSAV